jgi:subfamily B ATP-binding cassette protein MsbA
VRRLLVDFLWPLLAPHRSTATLLIGCGFLASMTEGIGISLFIPLFSAIDPDLAAVNSASGMFASIIDFFSSVPADVRVVTVAGVIFAAILGKAILSYATTYLSTRLAAESSRVLRAGVADVVLGGNPSTLSTLGHGRVMNVLSNESWKTGDALALSMLTLVSAFQAFVYLGVLMLVSWQMTFAAVLLLGLIALVVRWLTKKVGRLSRKITRANADVSRLAIDMVGGAEVIRGFGTEESERRQFEAASQQLTKDSVRSWGLVGVITPLYEIVAAAVIVGILLSASITGPGIAYQLVFVFVLFRLVPVVRRLEKDRAELLAAEGSIRETCAVIAAADEVDIRSGSKPFEGISEKIELVAANYQYAPDASLALDNVSLAIPARGITALVGPSGAGKSTLGRIILRLLDPTRGQVLVDGTPMTELDLSSWRNRVAVVPQRSFLFNATVRDNIAYGSPDAPVDDVTDAARAAGAHDFIAALADGYETRLGEEGVELSGGEAQRICLARAMIRKPELLLLDEATNALDSVSEMHVQQALESIKTDCCVVVIAHRLETVSNADRIVVLDKGRVVEQGTLQTLLERDGMFSRMYRASCRPDTSA